MNINDFGEVKAVGEEEGGGGRRSPWVKNNENWLKLMKINKNLSKLMILFIRESENRGEEEGGRRKDEPLGQ